MTLKTHLNISKILIGNLEHATGQNIAPFWFKLGSIIPDISLYHRMQEHHISKSGRFIKKYADRIRVKNIGHCRQSYLLGKTSHFLSDTFCLMHNHESGKKLSYHMKYEKQLSRLFKSLTRDVCLVNTAEGITYNGAKDRCLIQYILEKNFAYYAAHHTMKLNERLIHDISSTYFCCLHVLSEMISLGLKVIPASESMLKEAA